MKLSLAGILRGSEKTVRQTVDDFYESSDYRRGATRTRAWKRYVLEAFCASEWKVGSIFADLPIKDLTYWHVDAAVVAKLDKPGACQALIRVLRGFTKFAIKAGLLSHDPTLGIEIPSQNPHGFRAWTEEDIAIFEATYPVGTRERLIFTLALYTGLRRQDLVVLGHQHIRRGSIYICPEKTRLTTGVFLVIPIHPELAKVLALVPTSQARLLLNAWKRPFGAGQLTTWFGNVCRLAGLPMGLCLHGLRKAACRRLAEAGCTVHEIMAISGHRTMCMVERYTQTVAWDKLAKKAMRNLARAFPAAPPPPSRRSRQIVGASWGIAAAA